MISHATKFNLTLHYEDFRRRVNESLYVNPPGSIRETGSGQNVLTQRPVLVAKWESANCFTKGIFHQCNTP